MKTYTALFLAMTLLVASSCKKFLEIDPPKESLVQQTVFEQDDVAISALTGIYARMASSGYASGGNSSITAVCGLSADELTGYNAGLKEFNEAQVIPTNGTLNSLYSGPYTNIYTVNAILEGLSAPNGVSPGAKSQLRGEALFIRAFAYFYLVNLFGSVPLQLETDYRITRTAPRAPIVEVYAQILNDLNEAESLLAENYLSNERVRPNRAAVQALLARTYLYLEDWANAEKYASMIINQSSTFKLLSLDEIFLKNSQEAIWQLMPSANSNTPEGGMFILTGTPTMVSLKADFKDSAFETGDKRKDSWVNHFTNGTGTFYYPGKYKVKSSITVSEYSMVLRLAEQYLIRAEARAEQSNLAGGMDDLDKIRARAGLPLTLDTKPDISQAVLLELIQRERRAEFFAEWGHRWFDLKRTEKVDQALRPTKPGWQATDLLYPIPQAEISRNPNVSQNPGY